MQQDAQFKKLKGQMVVFKGEVREVGEKMFGGVFVSLRVDRLDELENINIEFIVPNSIKDQVVTWNVGETRIMRGRIDGIGDLEDDLTCKGGAIVSEAEYQGGSNLATPAITTDIQQAPEKTKTSSVNVANEKPKTEDLKAAIENARRAISWIKAKEEMTELRQEAELKKMKDMLVVFKGEVREVGEKVFGGTYVSLKVGRLNEFEDINIEFIVSGSTKEAASNWSVGETHILSGRVLGSGDITDDLTCKNGQIVTDEEYRKSL